MKTHGKPSSGMSVFYAEERTARRMEWCSDRQTDRQTETDMAKLTVDFRNFVNSPEKLFPRYCYRHPHLTALINLRPSRFLMTPSSPVTSIYIKVLEERTY